MNQRAPVGRLLSPAGFGLVLLMFLLPFLSVSCEAEGAEFVGTFTGIDMVVGGEPDLIAPGTDEDAQEAQKTLVTIFHDHLDLEPLALLAGLVILGGMAGALIRERLARHATGAGLAVLGAALLVAAQLRVAGRVRDAIQSVLGPESPEPHVTSRFGFWMAVAVLVALTAGHLVALILGWRAPPPALAPATATTDTDDLTAIDPGDTPDVEVRRSDEPGR
jgi:hypothetical protein